MRKTWMFAWMAILAVGYAASAEAAPDAASLFNAKCAMCHAVDSKKVGPALKDMNKDENVLRETISNGRKMMPKYGGKLSAEEIDAMVAYIKSTQ